MASMSALRSIFHLTTSLVLSSLYDSWYTRTPNGTSIPRRKNPLTGPTEAVPPHNLNDWNDYDHDAGPFSSAGITHSKVPGGIRISWTKPARWEDLVCAMSVYYLEGDDTDEPIQFGIELNAGDADYYDITTAAVGQQLAVSVVGVFNDGVEEFLSEGWPGAGTEVDLTGGDVGILTGNVPANAPQINSVVQTNPDAEDCGVETDADFAITFQAGTLPDFDITIEYKIGTGSWNVLTTVATYTGFTMPDVPADTGDAYYFRAKYTGYAAYGTEVGPRSILCGPL